MEDKRNNNPSATADGWKERVANAVGNFIGKFVGNHVVAHSLSNVELTFENFSVESSIESKPVPVTTGTGNEAPVSFGTSTNSKYTVNGKVTVNFKVDSNVDLSVKKNA